MTVAPIDPDRCPLCGHANACAMAQGATSCWCFHEDVAPDVLARVPLEAQGIACICRACATGRRRDAVSRRRE